MKRSRSGHWILDDPKYQYLTDHDKATIHKILRYSWGFNSINVIIEEVNGKETEHTWPRHHFKKIVQPNMVAAMVDVIKNTSNETIDMDISQRLFEYKSYIFKHNPEKLI